MKANGIQHKQLRALTENAKIKSLSCNSVQIYQTITIFVVDC